MPIQKKESIRTYLSTRSRSKQALDETNLEPTPGDLVQNDKMAADAVANTEPRQLILGLDTKMSAILRGIDGKIDKLASKIETLHGEVEPLSLPYSSLLKTISLARIWMEGYETSPTDTIQKVRTFAKDNLKLGESEVKQMSIRNGHRLQKREDNTPAPSIVVFLYRAERDAFLIRHDRKTDKESH
jgi:hypothetical protein